MLRHVFFYYNAEVRKGCRKVSQRFTQRKRKDVRRWV